MVKSLELISMNQRPSPHHQKKIRKQSNNKPKKQPPMKVVYISNPVRVTTSASGFRALVQELTGRDSDIAEILAREPPPAPARNHSPSPPRTAAFVHRLPSELLGGSDCPFQLMDDHRTFGSMEDYFSGLLPPALLYEPPQLDGGGGLFDGV